MARAREVTEAVLDRCCELALQEGILHILYVPLLDASWVHPPNNVDHEHHALNWTHVSSAISRIAELVGKHSRTIVVRGTVQGQADHLSR